jgi:TolB-like protein/AraC-like DNA-binding protein/Tfp pilus assembly protein PilF
MSTAEFLGKVTEAIESNMHDPNFGVGELADLMSMSRSSLLRQIKKSGGPSVNQLIREVRLKRAIELLRVGELNVSQISFEVGFSSPSYFIKCFKDEHGCSPGEYTFEQPSVATKADAEDGINWRKVSGWSTILLLIIAAVWFFYKKSNQPQFEKPSIAVLPFTNQTSDSSQLYLVNGMTESILTNLQRLGELRVISRTSVEQYRDSRMAMTEIAEELGVDYVVEGSFQKYRNEMLLTVQLIDGASDQHVWSEQYRRGIEDIFNVQAEVSGKIAEAIQVAIAPEITEQIFKKPTENTEAYDQYLQGVAWTRLETETGLDSAIVNFNNAIALDEGFAWAYAYLSICYYYKDIFKLEKEYTDLIGKYADRAVLLDPNYPVCLISKALYYMHRAQYEEAVTYFERVLDIAPNSATTYNYLAEIYTSYLLDIDQYLIHALTAYQLDLSGNDSSALSFTHLHLSNALAQSGMIDRAEAHIHQSLAYDPNNLYSKTLEIYIDLTEDQDVLNARNRMSLAYQKDSSRLDLLQELAKLCYTMEDYEAAAEHYRSFIFVRSMFGLNIFHEEDVIMAFVFDKVGDHVIADSLIVDYKEYLKNDQSVYRPLQQSFLAIYEGHLDEAIDYMDEFIKADDFMYWVPAFLEDDPLFMQLATHSEYDRVLSDLKDKFEKIKDKRIRKLTDLGLL